MNLNLNVKCESFLTRYFYFQKDIILTKLKYLYKIILNWFSMDCLDSEPNILTFCNFSLILWPWICTNLDIQCIYMNTLAVLSEDSLPGLWSYKQLTYCTTYIFYLFQFVNNSAAMFTNLMQSHCFL